MNFGIVERLYDRGRCGRFGETTHVGKFRDG